VGMRGARLPTYTLMDIGSGRLFRHKGTLVLEQFHQGTWTELGRYGRPHEAAAALDKRMGEGVPSDHLRLRADE
jgi:hypothetical protein